MDRQPEGGKLKLGDILVNEGVVTQTQLDAALRRQGSKKKKLGKVLIDMGVTTEEEIALALCKQLGLTYERLAGVEPPADALRALDKEFVLQNRVMPLSLADGRLTVAVADPLDMKTLDEAAYKTGLKVSPVVGTETEILECIDRTYQVNNIIQQMLKTFQVNDEVNFVALPQDEEVDVQKIFNVNTSAPAFKLLAYIFMDAYYKNANEVHVESMGDGVRLRYGIEGDLYGVITMPGSVKDTLFSYMKRIANLDVSNRRSSQAGKGMLIISGSSVGLDVSSMPTVDGERVKVRLQYKDRPASGFAELGTPEETVKSLVSLVKAGQGVILLGAPRNSGKKSIIYALLKEMDPEAKDIVTVETRTEKKLEGITQLTAPERSMPEEVRKVLRQMPDIIMVDALRDKDSAEAAFECANKGALVVTSITARNSADAIARLINFGLEPWLVASNLLAVASPRLLRKVCPKCSGTYSPELAGIQIGERKRPDTFYKGAGCKYCFKSGYRGHTSICEVIPAGHAVKDMILRRAGEAELRRALGASGARMLADYAWDKVSLGVTTPEEAAAKVSAELWEKPEPLPAGPAPRPARHPGPRPPAPPRPPERTPAQPAPEEKGPAKDAKCRILIAIPNKEAQKAVRERLVADGCDVFTANTGGDTLQTIYAEGPDLLVCDLLLPRIDELTSYKKIYDARKGRVPVIVVAPRPRKEGEKPTEDELQLDAEARLNHPINLELLAAKAKQVIREKSPRRDWVVL